MLFDSKRGRRGARLAMQDGNSDAREGFTRQNLTNRNVRRRLFADDDDNERPENLQGLDENRTNKLFEEARNNLEKQAKERWNFDFETETPLPGNYVWVKLDKDGKEAPNSRHNEDSKETTSETNRVVECKIANQTRCETGEEIEDD